MSSAQVIAEGLGGKKSGNGWTARCPAHDDKSPSLSIHEGPEGRALVHCHAGCSQEEVIHALREGGLWAPEKPGYVEQRRSKQEIERATIVAAIAESDRETGAFRDWSEKDEATVREAEASLIHCGIESILLRDVAAEPLHPIWPGVLFKGKATVIAGLPGDGKTLIACDVAARISQGLPWPCGGIAEPGHVLLLTAEDDPADTLRPRIEAAGADLDRVELITGAVREDPKTHERTVDLVSLTSDLARLEAKIGETGCSLLIIDPLTSFADTDTNKTAETRRLLDGLAQLARRTDVAILLITHLNKRADARKAMQMVAGSHVIVAAVRAAFATGRDPQDDQRRLLLPLKLNNSPEEGGFAFRVVTKVHPVCGETPTLEWETVRVEDVSADEALAGVTPRTQASAEKDAEAAEWLRERLSGGPVESGQLRREGRDQGIADRRFRQALKALKAASEPTGYQGKWFTRLPESDTEDMR